MYPFKDIGPFQYFTQFWCLVDFGATICGIGAQMSYMSQRAYTDRAWSKQNHERYWQMIKNDPLGWSVIDDLRNNFEFKFSVS